MDSRWRRSEVSFGPVGRVVMTVLLLLPVWWFLSFAGLFGIAGLVTYAGVFLPWALRDLWRPHRRPPTEHEQLQARMQAELSRERLKREAEQREQPPERW